MTTIFVDYHGRVFSLWEIDSMDEDVVDDLHCAGSWYPSEFGSELYRDALRWAQFRAREKHFARR